jgi:hypothetical protein
METDPAMDTEVERGRGATVESMDKMFMGLEEARSEILRLREQIAELDEDEALFSERLQETKEDRALASRSRVLRMDTQEGYLIKQGGDKWKRRYFVVDRTCLTYYEDDVRTGAPKGVFFLSPSTKLYVGEEQAMLKEVVPAGAEKGTQSQIAARRMAEVEAEQQRASAGNKRVLKSGLDKQALSSARGSTRNIAAVKANSSKKLLGGNSSNAILPPPSGPPPAILPPPATPPGGKVLPPPSGSPPILPPPSSKPPAIKSLGSNAQMMKTAPSSARLVNSPTGSGSNLIKGNKKVRPQCPPHLEPFSFCLVTNGMVLKLACENERELKLWTTCFEQRIVFLAASTRGYLKVDKGKYANVDGTMVQRCVLRGGEWKQLHFLLEPECLHAFKDQSLEKSKGIFAFDEGCSIDTNVEVGGNSTNRIFALVCGKEATYFEAENDEEYEMWCKKVSEAVDEVPHLLAKQMAELENIRKASAGMYQKANKRHNRRGSMRDVEVDLEEDTKAEDVGTKKGKLLKLPTKGNFLTHNTMKGSWKERFCSLDGYDGTFTYFDDAIDSDPKGSFALNSHCLVKQSDACPFAFEVIAPGRVVVLAALSEKLYQEWVLAIRAAIEVQAARQSTLNVLEQAALKVRDQFYDVTYSEKVATLGFQVNRRREWMCITQSDNPEVMIGSVLHAVNGKEMVGEVYKETLAHLRGWQPPLTLTFRRQVCNVCATKMQWREHPSHCFFCLLSL